MGAGAAEIMIWFCILEILIINWAICMTAQAVYLVATKTSAEERYPKATKGAKAEAFYTHN